MTIISTVTRMTDDVNGKFGTKLAQESAETTFSFRRWKLPPAVKVKQTRHSRRKKRQTRQLLPILSTFLSLFLFSFFFSLSLNPNLLKSFVHVAQPRNIFRGEITTLPFFSYVHTQKCTTYPRMHALFSQLKSYATTSNCNMVLNEQCERHLDIQNSKKNPS